MLKSATRLILAKCNFANFARQLRRYFAMKKFEKKMF